MLAPGPSLEAALAQAGDGGVEVRRDDGEVGAPRHGRMVLMHQVDLGALAFEPGEVFRQRWRRLDPLEAEQLEELDGALDVPRPYLDSHVLQHGEILRAGTTRNVLSASVG
jgi:hypothetical protein